MATLSFLIWWSLAVSQPQRNSASTTGAKIRSRYTLFILSSFSIHEAVWSIMARTAVDSTLSYRYGYDQHGHLPPPDGFGGCRLSPSCPNNSWQSCCSGSTRLPVETGPSPPQSYWSSTGRCPGWSGPHPCRQVSVQCRIRSSWPQVHKRPGSYRYSQG